MTPASWTTLINRYLCAMLAVGAGAAEGGLDGANMLKPALARGLLHCIGATTLSEYRQHIETDPAFARRFQVCCIQYSCMSFFPCTCTISAELLRSWPERATHSSM
jgi:hypothetical protein